MKLSTAIRTANSQYRDGWGTRLVVELGGGNYEAIAFGAYDGSYPIYHVATSPENTVSVSTGNSKTGYEIPSGSLHPDITCAGRGRWCYTRNFIMMEDGIVTPPCYALCNMADFRKTIHAAWHRNCRILDQSEDLFFWQFEAFLNKKRPRFFRWFVGGGVPNQSFLDRTKKLAERTKFTNFVMFDKGYDSGYDYYGGPLNMEIILSTWPGMSLPGKEYAGFQRSWLEIDPRKPEDGILCSGYCATCGMCWNLSKIRKDVVLHVH